MKKIEKTPVNKINRKLVRKFLDFYQQFEGISAADFEYSMHIDPEMRKVMGEKVKEALKEKPEEKEIEKTIKACNEPKELVNFMRKPIPINPNEVLRQKLLENEKTVIELIKEKCMRSSFDIFIENATDFFIRCKENCSDWIIENYYQFHSEYMREMMCLVLGFRGYFELVPFLMDEAERFRFDYPDELYERGPVLAVQELCYRFGK